MQYSSDAMVMCALYDGQEATVRVQRLPVRKARRSGSEEPCFITRQGCVGTVTCDTFCSFFLSFRKLARVAFANRPGPMSFNWMVFHANSIRAPFVGIFAAPAPPSFVTAYGIMLPRTRSVCMEPILTRLPRWCFFHVSPTTCETRKTDFSFTTTRVSPFRLGELEKEVAALHAGVVDEHLNWANLLLNVRHDATTPRTSSALLTSKATGTVSTFFSRYSRATNSALLAAPRLFMISSDWRHVRRGRGSAWSRWPSSPPLLSKRGSSYDLRERNEQKQQQKSLKRDTKATRYDVRKGRRKRGREGESLEKTILR